MKIEIWSDFACPFCYIGKIRFEEALKSFKYRDQVEISYKAYQLNPSAPKHVTTTAYEAFAASHNITVGLSFDYDHMQMTNTFDAHRLAKWAKTAHKEDQLTSRLMKAYFTDGLNIADHDTLSVLAEEIGLSKDIALQILKSEDYEELVLAEQQEARQLGVQGVPFFVLNRKYGISGAQQTAYFKQTLDQIWAEENPLKTLSDQDDSQACDHDECGIE